MTTVMCLSRTKVKMSELITRMFHEVTRTWSPVVGCEHNCIYCYASDLAEGRLRHLPRYHDGFKPKLVVQELTKRFIRGLIFVSNMGDLFGEWVTAEWIYRVNEAIRRSPKATFLFLTKNPARYHNFLDQFPLNVILGATIESNRDHSGLSSAPSVSIRAELMANITPRFSVRPKMVSIEPILDFDLDPFVELIVRIQPEFVYIGYDNHKKQLPEPSMEKTKALIAALREFTEVRTKPLRHAWWGRVWN